MPDLVRRGARSVGGSATLDSAILPPELVSLVLLVGSTAQIVAVGANASLLAHTVLVLGSGQKIL